MRTHEEILIKLSRMLEKEPSKYRKVYILAEIEKLKKEVKDQKYENIKKYELAEMKKWNCLEELMEEK